MRACKPTISTCSCTGPLPTTTRRGALWNADGKIQAIGVSNFEPDQLLDLIAYNQIVPAVNQIETNLYCQRSAERVWMDKQQVAHMAYAP